MRGLLSAALFFGIWGICACSPQGPGLAGGPEVAVSPDSSFIVSDRPIHKERFIATLKLATPPALESAQHLDSGLAIPPAVLEAIDEEQQEVIAQLKKLSPQIEVIYRYRMILNGLAIAAPWSVRGALETMAGVQIVQSAQSLSRPHNPLQPLFIKPANLTTNNSVIFIEADRVHKELHVRGQGMKVGVIDTGIDYTHSMLGGSGQLNDYVGIDPNGKAEGFPNAKVVGGIDLVGSDYDSGSELWSRQVPKPDQNPIDEAGHGTHVAGTIAGIGDGQKTYSGVAPDAQLYAIKVFGKNGSTSDYAVLAGLEYSADPNQDGNPEDRLDVVNLSLGGGFGQPQILYNEAIRTLSQGGTLVVASAGNSGPVDYIVSAPSTADEAFSIGASVDDMPHNWTYDAARFSSKNHPDLLARSQEGPVSKPLEEVGNLQGELFHIGLGNKPLTPEQSEKLKGKVALLERGGQVSFLDKLKLVEAAGAIGAVVANSKPGDPFAMGGDGSVQIPAIMIKKEVGDLLKEELKLGPVTVNMRSGEKIEERGNIDTITDFSSRGPRSQDALFKPEIAAPGKNIISAMMGGGSASVAMSGTSMSGPHMAGVMTLLKQRHPELSNSDLKALAMTTAKKMVDTAGEVYPLSLQGAGRVRSFAAATSPLLIKTPALSLGVLQLGSSKSLRRELVLENLSDQSLQLRLAPLASPNIRFSLPQDIVLEPKQQQRVSVFVHLSTPKTQAPYAELNGEIEIHSSTSPTLTWRVPVMAVATQLSDLKVSQLKIGAGSETEASGAVAELEIRNDGPQEGLALPFNLIGYDDRKISSRVQDSFKSRSCDLESAGYRIVRKVGKDGEDDNVLQFAVKLYEPMTTWHYCEVSIQIDSNNDQEPDQELAGVSGGSSGFTSLLLDSVKARQIRLAFENDLAKGKEGTPSFAEAMVATAPMTAYSHSTIAIVEIPLKALKLRPTGELAVKVAALYADPEGYEADDYLSNQLNEWHRIDPRPESAGYVNLPETIKVAPGSTQRTELTRGLGTSPLVVYMPNNRFARTLVDNYQAVVPKPTYGEMVTQN